MTTVETNSAAKCGPVFEDFCNKKEVARRLHLKPRTLDDWMRRGLLPYYKAGRTVRFKWSQIEAHLLQTCWMCGKGRRADQSRK